MTYFEKLPFFRVTFKSYQMSVITKGLDKIAPEIEVL